jgi:hypothetical protein
MSNRTEYIAELASRIAEHAAVDEAAAQAATSQASPAPEPSETPSRKPTGYDRPPMTLPAYGTNSAEVAKSYNLPEDFYILQAAGNRFNPAAQRFEVSPKYRTPEYDAAETEVARWEGMHGVNAAFGKRQARQRLEAALESVAKAARQPAA